MATKLRIINGALTELGHRRVVLNENVESWRECDAVYDQVVEECLSSGSWNFAMEEIKADADTGVPVNFGFTEVFAKPADWVRTFALSADEYFTFPLSGNQVYDGPGYWSADSTPIYIRYVSNDTGLGLELTRWPQAFTRYVELELAARVAYRLTQNSSLHERMIALRDKARRTALNHDAANDGQPKFFPPGTWTMSRSGRLGRGDRGSRGSLTG